MLIKDSNVFQEDNQSKITYANDMSDFYANQKTNVRFLYYKLYVYVSVFIHLIWIMLKWLVILKIHYYQL